MLVLMDQVDFADREVPALEPLEFPHLAAIEHMGVCHNILITYSCCLPFPLTYAFVIVAPSAACLI